MEYTVDFPNSELIRDIRMRLEEKLREEKLPVPNITQLSIYAENSLKEVRTRGNGILYEAIVTSGVEIALAKIRDSS